ncbi:MAG: hypothetical protein P4L85_14560 [Paludisphaera borealis]|uniref:hypothetical protein n=1 Tax=Paludisphaera borealis TaxID=1387353 RepID=UPI00283C64B1|nr:hypothetical protein [Paludisphaera borealis]MDR3620570.1 hypothetical protein [Paludisphaera borealis]
MTRMNIGTAAILIGIVAIDLTILRALPSPFLLVPIFAIQLASLNLVLVQVVALRRPLGPFHLGFVGGGLLYGFSTLGLRTQILARLIDAYRMLTGDETIWRFNSGNQIVFAEQGLMLAMGLLACLASGALASYLEERLPRARRAARNLASGNDERSGPRVAEPCERG